MRTLGLDVSSAIVGVSVLDGTHKKFDRIFLDHIDLTKDDGLWDKIDHVRQYFNEVALTPEFQNLDHIGVEEALLSFRAGASSATTITMLLRMNIVVSILAREQWGITPQFIPAATARKKCGIKTIQKKKCGIDIKQQVFDIMSTTDLKDVVWPLKKLSKAAEKNGDKPKPKNFCYDETDAYVIAKSCLLLNS